MQNENESNNNAPDNNENIKVNQIVDIIYKIGKLFLGFLLIILSFFGIKNGKGITFTHGDSSFKIGSKPGSIT